MAQAVPQATLSDGLAALIRAIEPTTKTGLMMTRRDVAAFLDGLRSMLDEARHLETIADRAQWNAKALRDCRAALEAAVADGTIEMPPPAAGPTAGLQEGGAA
jgi:3-methyladenine DNA glycosylase Mpg